MANPYCAEQDIKDKISDAQYEQIVDDSGSDSTTDKTRRINLAIASSDNQINSYVGVKYDVPIANDATDARAVLKDISVDLSVWWLAARRWGELDAPSTYKSNYDGAIARLKDIAKGTMVLSVPDPPDNTGRASVTDVTSESRVHTVDNQSGLF
jgi:phage gp36-like protein